MKKILKIIMYMINKDIKIIIVITIKNKNIINTDYQINQVN